MKSVISESGKGPKVLVTDRTVAELWLDKVLDEVPELRGAPVIVIPDGRKDLETASDVWSRLSEAGMTRDGIIVNLGGGTVTDLGGFCAATFKRGVDYINIPTTLLAMADASAGGKTGIDFNGLKNEVGVFRKPLAVIGDAMFLKTLPPVEILSGFAEMLKTGLIADKNLYSSLIGLEDPVEVPAERLNPLIRRVIVIKESITEKDPEEQGFRKVLNFGHTAGHAFESRSRELGHPVPHGVAVGWGLLTELILSHIEKGLDSTALYPLASLIRERYPAFPFTCGEYEPLLRLMAHDKKNRGDGMLNFTLVPELGSALPDNYLSPETVKEALDITQDFLH